MRDEIRGPMVVSGEDEGQCARCGSPNVVTTVVTHHFSYGDVGSAVDLVADVPLHTCRACDLAFIDEEGEAACHDAVCAHLGVLTPNEIAQLRGRYNMTQQAFAAVTGLGVASLSRWERGELLQNTACDRLLRLMQFAENVERLSGIAGTRAPAAARRARRRATRFRAIEDGPVLRAQQHQFHLVRPQG